MTDEKPWIMPLPVKGLTDTGNVAILCEDLTVPSLLVRSVSVGKTVRTTTERLVAILDASSPDVSAGSCQFVLSSLSRERRYSSSRLGRELPSLFILSKGGDYRNAERKTITL